MKEYYFTFAPGHFSLEGEKMSDSWVRVTAADEMTAREYFADHFALPVMGSQTKWAFSYEEGNFQKHYFPAGEYGHLTVPGMHKEM